MAASATVRGARAPGTAVCVAAESVSPSVLQTMGGGARRAEAYSASARGEPVRHCYRVESSEWEQNIRQMMVERLPR